MRYVINIRGFNGAGKSSIIHTIKSRYEYKNIEYNNKIIAVQIPSLRLIILGSYERQCGGVDTYSSMDEIYKKTLFFVKKYPSYNILIEGAVFSTIKSKPLKFFRFLQKKYEINTIIVLLKTDPATCVNNILEHRGGNIRFDYSKYNQIIRSSEAMAKYFKLYTLLNDGTINDLTNNFLNIYNELLEV